MVTPAGRWTGFAIVLALAMSPAIPARALEGYFQHGYGARHKALAGAGAADGRDATIIVINPAGLVHADDEADMAVGVFSPTREMTGSGAPGLTPTGRVDSNTRYFFVPNSAFSYRLPANPYADVVGVSFYGNGANTDYADVPRNDCLNGGSGMYCGGPAGIDLQQYFMTLAIAKEIAPGFSLGVGPIIGMQMFRAKGVALVSPTSPTSPDTAWGIGVRGGFEWSVAPDFRIGGGLSSATYMQQFRNYADLLAGRGDCDVPANGQAGIAYDARPDLTLMLDYQYIAYSTIGCVANPATNLLFAPFGAEEGAGFGWRDLNVVKLGVEWRLQNGLTLRGGYAYNNALFGSRDVELNILAPAATQHHITAGGALKLDEDWTLELAAMYAPKATVSGSEIGLTSGHLVDVATRQYEFMAGVKYYYDPLFSR
jgi:long-chain fatty acid transport protein